MVKQTDFFDHHFVAVSQAINASETPRDIESIERLSKLVPPSRILDAGCGYGRLSAPLAEIGYDVVAIDTSKQLLDFAESRQALTMPRVRCRFVLADARDAMRYMDEPADLSICWDTTLGYGRVDDDVQFISSLLRCTRLGGLVLVAQLNLLAVSDYCKGRVATFSVPIDGGFARDFVTFDPELSMVSTLRELKFTSTQESIESKLDVRLYSAADMYRLAKAAGGQLIASSGRDSGEPAASTKERMVVYSIMHSGL